MGHKTKQKMMEAEEKENAFKLSFNRVSKIAKEKASKPADPLILQFVKHSAYFFRNPKDFVLKTKSSNRDKHLLLFARFVFGKYTVPKILDQVWEEKSTIGTKFDYKQWYICVATGGSLYKEHLKDVMTKKEVHNFLQCKYPLKPDEAIVYAVARTHGATEGIANRIAKSRISGRPFTAFWRECIRFFSTEGNVPESVEQINDLTDYLSNKHAEDRKFSIIGFGYTLKSIIKKMEDWHYALRRVKAMGNHQWEGHPHPDQSFNYKDDQGQPIVWLFKQLKTSKDLAAEGTAMHHCVFSYRDRCISGSCSIWSVKTINYMGVEKRRVTVEMTKSGAIVQTRGFANRTAKNDEKSAINHWLRTLRF